MTYLDERIIAKFSSLPYPDEGIYQYTVYVGEEYIFIGNKFLFTAESDTTIDITDLVRNYFYDHFDYSYSEYEVYVHLQIGTTTAVSQILQIVPVYRYPNYAATDLYFDGTKNTIMLSGNLDNSFTAYNIPDSLLPTYPKVTTANINIDYYIANVTDDNYVIDYGPIVQISQEQPQSFYHITGDLTPTTTTDSLWYTGISEFAANQLATIGNSIIYSTKTTSQPTILYITTAAGLTKQRTIDSFPYSYSESTSGNYDNQCPISFAVATADETLIASNVTVTGNISTTINVSIKQTGTNYNIFITQSGERTIEQDFADQILLYDPDTRFATTDLADVNYSLSVSGDLTLSSTTTIKPTYTMQGNFAFYILESGVVKYAAQYGM